MFTWIYFDQKDTHAASYFIELYSIQKSQIILQNKHIISYKSLKKFLRVV